MEGVANIGVKKQGEKMSCKKTLSTIIVASFLLTTYLMTGLPATAGSSKSTERIAGGVYSPGDDFGPGNITSDLASYGTAIFYTPDTDQPADSNIYDVQYYKYPFGRPAGADPSKYPVYYGRPAWWYAPTCLGNNTPDTEYMVVVEVINGVNNWSGMNFTGSTNMTATGNIEDYPPNIYLEQIPTPQLKSRNYTSGEIIINWTGLNENISDNCLDSLQSWKGNANNVLNYSVYRSTNGGDFVRVGTSTPQVRGGEVSFVDTVEPGDYYYRIAVNYRYGVNDGTNIIDQNGVNPGNTKDLPGIFVSTGRSNVSEIIKMLSKPVIVLNYPNGGEDWTGGSVHEINYTISEGTSPYTIYFNYTADGGTHSIGVDTKTGSGTYTYLWAVPGINSTMVEVRVTVIDINILSDMEISKTYFTIDTAAPGVFTTAPSNAAANIGRTDLLTIMFTEPMNTTSVEKAFSITPPAGNWIWTWTDAFTMKGIHSQPFEADTTYSCIINNIAMDDSAPGNNMFSNYTWSFKTVPGLSVTITSPLGGEKWVGNTTHNITYMIMGGTPNYNISITYTADNVTYYIVNETNTAEGLHSYPWMLPNTNLSSVIIMVKITDSLGVIKSDTSSQFIIDTTKPEIIIDSIIPGNNMIALVNQPIIIQFTEPMNTTFAEAAFSVTNDPGGWIWTWNTAKDMMTGTHNPFISGGIYTCTIKNTAVDNTDPGNPLNTSYTWVFTAVTGRGDLTVVVYYPSSPEVDKNYEITMKIYNNGPRAINVSGSLIVTFYMDNKVIDTKNVHPILKDTYTEVSSESFMFPSRGIHILRIRITPTNQDDLIQGSAQPYEETHMVDVVQPIGIGPYVLIILMVMLVTILGVLTIFLVKKNERIKKIINDWAENRTAKKKVKEEKIEEWAKKRMEEKRGK